MAIFRSDGIPDFNSIPPPLNSGASKKTKEKPYVEHLPMNQEFRDFDDLERLLTSAKAQAQAMRERTVLRQAARSRRDESEDYVARLAERAIFRRLLNDEALDGVRFRWLYEKYFAQEAKGIPEELAQTKSIDEMRKVVDKYIELEEAFRGPSA